MHWKRLGMAENNNDRSRPATMSVSAGVMGGCCTRMSAHIGNAATVKAVSADDSEGMFAVDADKAAGADAYDGGVAVAALALPPVTLPRPPMTLPPPLAVAVAVAVAAAAAVVVAVVTAEVESEVDSRPTAIEGTEPPMPLLAPSLLMAGSAVNDDDSTDMALPNAELAEGDEVGAGDDDDVDVDAEPADGMETAALAGGMAGANMVLLDESVVSDEVDDDDGEESAVGAGLPLLLAPSEPARAEVGAGEDDPDGTPPPSSDGAAPARPGAAALSKHGALLPVANDVPSSGGVVVTDDMDCDTLMSSGVERSRGELGSDGRGEHSSDDGSDEPFSAATAAAASTTCDGVEKVRMSPRIFCSDAVKDTKSGTAMRARCR